MRETCKNCGNMIGALETAHVFKEHIVCGACNARLVAAGSTVTPPPPPAPTMPPPPSAFNPTYVPPPSIPMAPCPLCMRPLAMNAPRCIHCGHYLGVRCPTCGQPAKPYYQWYIIVAVVLLFPLGLLLLLLPRQALCKRCGVEFDVSTVKV